MMHMDFETIYQNPRSDDDRERILRDLRAEIGSGNVSSDIADRISSSHGFWMVAERWTVEGKVAALPDVIAWPQSTGDVAKVLRYANDNRIPIIPYGGGSGVVGGCVPRYGGISLDIKRMNKLIEVDEVNLRATVQAGMNGMSFEHELRRRGYTMGHSPQSICCSSVGGWVATNATGHFSTRYGGIEEMLLGLEAVLPTGRTVRGECSPRRSAGPEVYSLFIGSEGTLGVITEVTFKIFPEPEGRFLTSYTYDTIDDSLESVRAIMRRGLRPAVVRIYDKEETKRHFYDYPEAENRVMAVFVIEGEEKVADVEKDECEKICSEYGVCTGEGPVRHWFETRFNVSETSLAPQYGAVFDTIETSVCWSRAPQFYKNTIKAMHSIDGVILASGHASHFYPQGVCFYFTFGGVPPKNQTALEFYQKVWDAAVSSFLENGGHISHHHGIGINRSRWLSRERSSEMIILQKIKQTMDPNNIMNPGLITPLEEGAQ